MSKPDSPRTKQFCLHLWDSLFDAIAGASVLSAPEKRVLEGLWTTSTVRRCATENYPGHVEFARHVRMGVKRLRDTLESLEEKGLIKPCDAAARGYFLNPLLLEAAYESVKSEHPDLIN
ncbi:MAG TPA: hypothetical protein VN934_04070 [Candidatus Tumulicola sp.]|nr:hypothetical protein [Candidatus Tumulicola sp.]